MPRAPRSFAATARTFGFAGAGVIHLLPLPGVFGTSMLQVLYGLRVDDAGLVLLLRHRALLFGMLAVLLFGAIVRSAWRAPARIAGFASTIGFVLLAPAAAWQAGALQRVLWFDVIAIGCLALTAWPRTRSPGE